MIKKIKDFFFKDVDNENEVKMYALIMRCILLVFIIYGVIGAVYSLACLQIGLFLFDLFETGLSGFLFSLTYKNKTMPAVFAVILLFCIHIGVHIRFYGLDTGVMQLSYISVMLVFITDYVGRLWKKLCGVSAILLLCLLSRLFISDLTPVYGFDSCRNQIWRIVHMIVVSCMIISAIYFATSDFSQMRQKLTLTNDRLRDVAGKDPLTGLSNRRSTLEYIDKCVAQYGADDMKFITLVMGDVDLFKRVNDTYGHDNGDIVLKDLANIMGAALRGKGMASRWGGEEFLMVFANYNGDEVYEMLTVIQREIAELEYNWNGDKVKISLTFGVAEYGNGLPISDTIKEADEKLYIGKERGRNTIVY